MKKLKRLLPLILACTMALSSCSLLGGGGGESASDSTGQGGGGTTINNAQTPTDEHLQTDTLHKVRVTETNRPFVVNGKSEYTVLIPENANAKLVTAANYFIKYIKMATGCQLKLESGSNYSWNNSRKWIVFDRAELFNAAGLSMPADDIGTSGYYIKSQGDSVFLTVKEDFGYHRAALSLLTHIVGYDMLWSDTVIFEKTGETLPDMEIIEAPDFDFYIKSNQMVGDGVYGMGFDSKMWISAGGSQIHNSFKYLPKADYLVGHPKWYSIKDQNGKSSQTQLCLNAQGDEAERKLMIETVAAKLIEYIDAEPTLATISFTHEDGHTWCGCDTCIEMRDYYNGSNGASAVKFCNEVDNIVQDVLQKRAEATNTPKRLINIAFFAYRASEAPPVKKNADGSYSPIDQTVVCNPNVGVYIAPIMANYQEVFYSDKNEVAREAIRGWAAVSNNLYMWLYDTNFHNYFFPLNSWDSKIGTFRFCRENNVIFMYSQSQFDTGAVSHFSRFKDYITSKAYLNVNVNFNDLKAKYFKHYFGPAEKVMTQFYDELQIYMEYLTMTYPASVYGGYKESIGEKKLWPKKVLDGWLKLVEEAYVAIEPLKESDPEKYELYKNHIMLEGMFPRYGLLNFYQGTYSAQEFYNTALQFKKDCEVFSMTKWQEGRSIEEMFKQWGV